MKFKNISGQVISVKRVDGTIQVQPGEEFFTAPVFVASLIETGDVQPISLSYQDAMELPPMEALNQMIAIHFPRKEVEIASPAEKPKRKALKEAE